MVTDDHHGVFVIKKEPFPSATQVETVTKPDSPFLPISYDKNGVKRGDVNQWVVKYEVVLIQSYIAR